MALSFDLTIKASDLLTSLTILVSVIALLISWSKDRDAKVREEAGRVRAAAATTLVKLERWQELQRSMYHELQPVYVETSEMLAVRYDVIAARDHLWKQINAQRVRVAGRVLDAAIETAYVDLFAYYPRIRRSFLAAIAKLKQSEAHAAAALLHDTQAAVMSFEGKQAGYTSAMLGNELRAAAAPVEEDFLKRCDATLAPIRDELYSLIETEDRALLNQIRGATR